MTKNIFLIHGAWSSNRGFNYLLQNIRYDNIDTVFVFKYDCNVEDIDSIIKRAKKELANSRSETIVVGHSLGGLIALSLHDELCCEKIITLSSPLSGIEMYPLVAKVIKARAPIIVSIAHRSQFIQNLQAQTYTKPIRSFISTSGFNPFIVDKSDGVVTIASQEQWLPATAVSTYLKCNHFEILQRDEIVHAVNQYTV